MPKSERHDDDDACIHFWSPIGPLQLPGSHKTAIAASLNQSYYFKVYQDGLNRQPNL